MLNIKKLSNGIRLVCEKMPYVKSVSVGVWVAAGSFYEEPEYHGISHFIEHMMFKGTKNRSAKALAEEMDFAGGQLNAFTARDCTCYYTKTLEKDLELSLSLLSDMLLNSLFAGKDIKTEKLVVKEEIDMYEDNPEELAHDLISDICYPGHPFGQNILGSHKSVSSFAKPQIVEYMDKRYRGDNMVIAVAGNYDEHQLEELCEIYFGKIKEGGQEFSHKIPPFKVDTLIKRKAVEQANLVFAFEGLDHFHGDMYAMLLLSNILGGSMSSRLFQSIREEKGLAYSVYACPNVYAHAGYITVYAGCAADNYELVKNLILEEIDLLAAKGISETEFIRTKNQLRGSCALASETTGNRMSSCGKQLLLHGEIISDDETLKRIDDISEESINRTLKLFDTKKASLCVIMPEEGNI